jgi:hypothetical protein
VKYHSNPQKENLLDVRNVSEKEWAIITMVVLLEETITEVLDLEKKEKCIKQFVLNVAHNVKYHSNQQKASLFFAKIVLEKTNSSK